MTADYPDTSSSSFYADTLWVCPHHELLVWQSWDDYEVVFNPIASTTHILNPLAREILDMLGETPLNYKGLISSLESVLDMEIDLDVREKILTSLEQLDSIGLISPHDFVATYR